MDNKLDTNMGLLTLNRTRRKKEARSSLEYRYTNKSKAKFESKH